MANEPEDPDQAVREARRANRKPLFIGLGVVVAIVVAVLVYVKMGESAARSALADKGYTDIKLESTGMMSWKYEATKGAATCSGTVSRSLGSISTQESCITREVKKSRSTREQIEGHFAEDFGKYGFDTFTCPDIDKQAEASCTISAKNGAKATVTATATERNDDGTWAAWHTHHPVLSSVEEMKSKLTKGLTAALVAKYPKATFDYDCGSGPIVFDDDNKFSCKLRMQNPDKSPTLHLTSSDDGMAWTVDGI